MRVGDLRHRVTFEELTVTQDAYGGTVESWAAAFTVWARVDYMRAGSRQFFAAQQANSEAHGSVTIRNRAISPTMRMRWNNRVLEILVPFTTDAHGVSMTILFKEALDRENS